MLIELLNELNELVITTLAVKLFKDAVVELTELLNVFELVANVLNTEELKKGVTTANEEVVAYPKLVI